MKYKIYTLGCKVNEYESEAIASILDNHGYTKGDNPDICIINTCTVTNTADSKSRKLIRSVRKQYPEAILAVAGCMVQNKKDNLDIDADIIVGNNNKTEIINYIKDYNRKKVFDVVSIDKASFENMSLNNFDLTRAYIKIQDGCDNYCSFCIIPYVRGHVRCKKFDAVISEAKTLVKNGHKEIVLTGIHTGNYHDSGRDFADLLSSLVKIKGLERLRISSVEIMEINNKVLDVMQNSSILVDHMHIPLQSGSNDVLKAMNRKYDVDYFIKRISEIRNVRPNISITTDVIVGFPGETEENFKETIDTIKRIKFTKLHVFPYSDREGTVASKMKEKIPRIVKKKRVSDLLKLSRELEEEYMKKYIDSNVEVLFETYKDGYLIGHTGNYLLIKVKGEESLINNIVRVNVKKLEYPYLLSEVNVK